MPISNILFIFGALVLALCSIFCIYQWNMVKKFRGFPSQRMETQICLLLFNRRKYQKDSITKLFFQRILNSVKAFQSNGICVMWFLKPYVFVYSGEYLKDLVNAVEIADKSSVYDINKLAFGNGLIGSKYEIWKIHRKMLNPAFNTNILKIGMPCMNKNAFQLAQELETVAGKSLDDVFEYLKRCAFQTMAAFVLGLELDNERHATMAEKFMKIVNTGMACIIERIFHPWLYMDSLLPLFQAGRKYLKHIAEIDNVLRDIINELIADRQRADSNAINSCGNIILNLHLQDSSFTEQDVRDHFLSLIVAGYDTVSAAMLFCFYTLARHPEVQEKAYCEVKSLVPDGDIIYDDLAKLKYLECVIKETLRLYPIVPLIARKVSKDIQCGRYTIPKGSELCFHIYLLHRDPNVFPEPEKFDPERFTDSSVIRPWMFAPFSEGFRNCIGKKFAMMELKVQLVHVLRRFRITTEDVINENDLDWSVSLKPEKNIRFLFQKRLSKDLS